jgi:hypothetical protein
MVAVFVGLISAILLIEPPSSKSSEIDAKEIVQKAIKAYGGVDKVKKMSCFTLKTKGEFLNDGQRYPYVLEAWYSFPSSRKMVYHFDKDTLIQGLNPAGGWESRSGDTREMTENEIAAIREGMYRFQVDTLVALVTDKSLQISHAGEKEINHRRAVGVKVQSKNHLDMLLYFDSESGLQVKVEIRSTDGSGHEALLEYYFHDHKEFDSVKRPCKIVVFINGDKKEEFEVTEMEFPQRIDEKVFREP